MIFVQGDSEAEWNKLGGQSDAIPDPMIVRTAELWLSGRSGCQAAGLDDFHVWESIALNVGALLTFFDALVGRESLPLIQYWETFARPPISIDEFFPGFFRPAVIDGALYENIKLAVTRKIDRKVLLDLPDADVFNVLGEMIAYHYQWHPWVDIDLPEPRMELARYVVGGLVFGAYAQATGADHLVQPKRSRLLVALSAPTSELSRVRFEQEDRLFSEFREACAAHPNAHVDDRSGAPTVLPYLLRKPTLATSTTEVVRRATKLRNSRLGQSYREWQKRLRTSWALGTNDEQAGDDVASVARKLEKRIATGNGANRPKLMTVSVGVPGPVELKAELDVPTPRWLSRWLLDHVHMRAHRRLLYRLALSEHAYHDITLHLHNIWKDS